MLMLYDFIGIMCVITITVCFDDLSVDIFNGNLWRRDSYEERPIARN